MPSRLEENNLCLHRKTQTDPKVVMSSKQSEQLQTAAAPPQTSILLHPNEFAYDEEKRLGRANGNTYQRRPGIENVHDGQIMVRLKKKRYIIIDYGYIPKPEDYAISNASAHISIPEGAGQQRCATKDCPRVGVPVMLYDSEPSEAMSLYLRGGLCFSCQRAVNEKRRTKRKRKPEEGLPFDQVNLGASGDVRSLGSSGSRFKVNNEVVELNSDAIIINGAVAGTRSRGPGYQHPEIGADLLQIMSELSNDTMSLVSNLSTVGISSPAAANMLYQKAFLSASKATYLLTQWKASYDEHSYAAAAAAAGAVPVPPPGHGYNPYDPNAVDHAVAATEAAFGSNNNTNGGAPHHHLYSMNHAMMNNAAATSLYGMGAMHHPAAANSNNHNGMIGVPTLAHVPAGAASMANIKSSNPQAPSKNGNRSAEV
mmetsp:Transcript_14788/g.22097  ORF Transcript_14788/g.22097 Transcript_14788/m.22097 type:complete len:426 (-) Transcript_14788:43-1320(-)